MTNVFEHLEVCQLRLSNERARRNMATGQEREWREHNCRGIIREIEDEVKFLESRGVTVDAWRSCTEENVNSLDELLDELLA